ncbi:TrkA family potassium uptake protein [Halopenitus sp. H-Gu1]|uniref:potassium channel family protein n=1 Tax=Halopenitus sp. H-Gu1 TaxID=3242697 RepID=UPI00359DFAC3
MDRWKQRAVGYFLFVGVALVLTAMGYQWGMRVYEGRPRTLLDSFQFAVEMFTTTGFGGDSPWTSPEMQAFIAVTDLLGMAVLVGALPVLVGPLLERALSTAAPQKLTTDVTDHVVICSYTTRAEELIEELDSNAVPYVIVEPDRGRADELYEDGHRVIRADPESTEGLEAARLRSARALFADVSDQVDASIVLAAKELAGDLPVVSVVEDANREKYHRLAGADHVLSPRQLLGESLAQKVTTALRSQVDEAVEISEYLQLAEVSIRHGSDLAGTTLADSRIRERSGVNVIGAWFRGEFDASPSPDATLMAGTVLIVSGRSTQLERLVEMTHSSVREFQVGKTVVVGHGTVGRTVTSELDDVGIPYTVVDWVDEEGVDVVGDATETETLTAAGIEEAQTVVLALPDDTTTEFATLVVRDLAPDTEIITRVEENANVSKTYRAGADYVLSLATVTGRMSASYLLENRDVLSLNQQVEVTRTPAPKIVGQTIQDADIRKQTDCTVIAIKRNDDVITDIGPETKITDDDELVIVGTDDGIREFERLFT